MSVRVSDMIPALFGHAPDGRCSFLLVQVSSLSREDDVSLASVGLP